MTGAHLRTLIVAGGLGFTGTALGGACLDYAGEDWGTCLPTGATSSSSGAGSGVGSGQIGVGSGEGPGAPVPPKADDCATPDGG